MPNSLVQGAYHIANNRIEYEPQRLNNFTLIVEDIDGVLRSGAAEGSTDPNYIIQNAQEEIKLGLKTCDIPNVTQPKIEIHKGNSKIKFPGKPEFSDINLSAYDLMGSNIKDTFLAWQNLCYNRKYDYVGNVANYKKNCTLYEYTPAGEVVRYWEIKGAWPTSVTITGFNTEDNGSTAEVSVTLSLDWAEMHLPDEL